MAASKLPAPGSKDLAGTGRFIESSYQLLTAENDKLARLDRPTGDGKQLGAFFDDQRAALATLRKAGEQARRGDATAAGNTFNAAAQQLVKVKQELSDYGFVDCGT